MTGRRGFTLLELVVVMTIIAVMAGGVAPRFADFAARREMAASAHEAAALLGFAREWARAHGTAVLVQWQEDGARVTAERDPDGAPGEFTPLQAGGEALLQLPAGVQIAALQEDGQPVELPCEVVFYPDGRAADLLLLLEDEAGRHQWVEYLGRYGVARLPEDGEIDEELADVPLP